MYSMRISVIFQMGHVCGKFITYPETKLSCGGWGGGGALKKVQNKFHQ